MSAAPLTEQIADEAHHHPRLTCPVCGARVTFHIEAGFKMLDYHHDKRVAMFDRWCAGSDVNLTDWIKCQE